MTPVEPTKLAVYRGDNKEFERKREVEWVESPLPIRFGNEEES